MSPILLAVLIVGGVGLVLGLILAVASVLLSVPVDPRVEQLCDVLPGANCGGCGHSGCEAYAAALVAGTADPGMCSPGGQEVANAIARVLGKESVALKKKVAAVRCAGCEENATTLANYENVDSCKKATLLYGGGKACLYGCLGLGDCAAVCPYGAINVENGLARVDATRCAGCGLCVETCPRRLLSLVPDPPMPLVVCRNTDKGALTRKVCKSGCIGCGKCTKACPHEAVLLHDNVAVIHPEVCQNCGACAAACPVGCIQ
ncbi:MAG: RnfABCDGE type electron transport complex subunit B [Ruminococcaceae bacterium]|nr:RnfABCDGE type electron transport complex subunit B [Oscillospiraceae bacterium]